MKEFIPKLKKYSPSIYRILLFIITTIIISSLLPRVGRFKYEFKKGEPWRYDVLIAPFDFRIYKTDQELKVEKDSIFDNFRPYFIQNNTVHNKVAANVTKSLEIHKSGLKSLFSLFTDKADKYDSITKGLNKILSDVYNKGVVLVPDEYVANSGDFVFNLIHNNLVEANTLTDFFTARKAYQYTVSKLEALPEFNNIKLKKLKYFVNTLNLDKFIEPNIILDKERTDLERNNLLKNIALTEGIVLSGQKIIDKGELVDVVAMKKLVSYRKEYEGRVGGLSKYNIIYVGQIIITSVLVLCMFMFLFYYRKDVYDNIKHIMFLLLMLIIVIVLTWLSYKVPKIPVWVIPFAILPLIVRTFLDSRLGFFFHVLTILLAAFFIDDSFGFIFLQIPVGVVSIFTLYRMERRSQIISSAVAIFITYSVLYAGLILVQEGTFESIGYYHFIYFVINAFLILMVYPLIYVFEKLFGFISGVTLVELSDTNHPLLRNLAENAPGTFQHSIQVGNLAQEAAYSIGANPLLVRAGAMYHDIGKSYNAFYFTENQTSGINPHQNMSYEDSAKIVISHIEKGVKLAKKHGLPEKIIDFIATHQGTTKTRYFYNSFINENPDVKPNEADFTYPGPTPFTKETAILMMADSIEAASRSLKEYTDEAIEKLVEGIVNAQMQEKQFDNAPITFKEISVIKSVFKQKLKNIYHARVSYPGIKK